MFFSLFQDKIFSEQRFVCGELLRKTEIIRKIRIEIINDENDLVTFYLHTEINVEINTLQRPAILW